MNVLCRAGMLVMCYLLLAFVFCISLSLLLLFAYSIIIGALYPGPGETNTEISSSIDCILMRETGVNVTENSVQSASKYINIPVM